MLIDTHCHLTHERFNGDLPEVLENARQAGVGAIIAIASDLDDSRAVRELWEEDESSDSAGLEIWGTAGVHPHEASAAPSGLRDCLIEAVESDSRVIALGECGLDYHYDHSPRRVQRRVFDGHIELAQDTGLPLVVHCRAAEDDMKDALRAAQSARARGVLHCFPGDPDLLDAALEADWMVSFTGLVTFASFEGEEAVRRVPRDRYMLETDGPYMAPVPFRGRRNEPAMVPHIRDRVAELRGESGSDVENDTTDNARRFFGLLET